MQIITPIGTRIYFFTRVTLLLIATSEHALQVPLVVAPNANERARIVDDSQNLKLNQVFETKLTYRWDGGKVYVKNTVPCIDSNGASHIDGSQRNIKQWTSGRSVTLCCCSCFDFCSLVYENCFSQRHLIAVPLICKSIEDPRPKGGGDLVEGSLIRVAQNVRYWIFVERLARLNLLAWFEALESSPKIYIYPPSLI